MKKVACLETRLPPAIYLLTSCLQVIIHCLLLNGF